jgi:hypothetical protein
MATVKPTIKSLNFDGIKTSIIDYIKSKPEFTDYDFAGSALNSLVDILAYNTLYYSHYSNMISNEGFLDTAKLESSIVSLCKPLGIVVPGKNCSKATYTVRNDGGDLINIFAYATVFPASSGGINYNFYTIQDYEIQPESEVAITLYEAKTATTNIPIDVDLDTQTVFLGTTDIDIETIEVKVNDEVWTKKTAVDSDVAENSKVYFIERSASGFFLIFGKKTINDFAEMTIGQDITETDNVTVSYLVSGGSAANNISLITITPLTTINSESSYGGTDGPDLDLIKAFAPKFFASNDRAVTKDDYYGILFANNLITNVNEINVWGGEDAEPVHYGRVYVSIKNETDEDSPRVKQTLTLLSNKSVITVVPEYVIPTSLSFNTSLIIRLNSTVGTNQSNLTSTLKTTLNTEYSESFNFEFRLEEADTLLKQKSRAVLQTSINTSETNISAKINYSTSDRIIYFKNQFFSSVTIGGAFNSDPIPTSLSGFSIILSDFPTEFNNGIPTIGKIIGRFDDGNLAQTDLASGIDLDDLGYVDYTNGIVVLYESFLSKITDTTALYDVFAIPAVPTFVVSKNEALMSINVKDITYT